MIRFNQEADDRTIVVRLDEQAVRELRHALEYVPAARTSNEVQMLAGALRGTVKRWGNEDAA